MPTACTDGHAPQAGDPGPASFSGPSACIGSGRCWLEKHLQGPGRLAFGQMRLAAEGRGSSSRIHPKHKTRQHLTKQAQHHMTLTQRAEISLWIPPRAIRAGKPRPFRRRGATRKYRELALETALTPRLLFRSPPRQAKGYSGMPLEPPDLSLEAPGQISAGGDLCDPDDSRWSFGPRRLRRARGWLLGGGR